MLEYVLLLLLSVFQLLPLVRTRNPKFFPCDNEDDPSEVDCSQRPLFNVPLIRSTLIVSLDLSETKIQQVGKNAFSGVPNLQTLRIMRNCLPAQLRALGAPSCRVEIHKDAFKGLQKLRALHLAGNSLTSIPLLPSSLEVLDLECNQLYNFVKPLGTPNLSQLLLYNNCYYGNPCNRSFHISESVLNELTYLKNLSMGFNNVTSIPLGLPPSLESLDLRENKLTVVVDGAFANLTRLQTLNLGWNCQRCDHAAQPCFPCPDNAPLKLHPHSFYVRNTSITYLSLRGNSLRTIPEGLFSPLDQLQYLDLSDNLLAYAIQNGTFFKGLKKLKGISLIYNYEPLKTFKELVLSPYLSQMSGLKYLLLSGNFFQALSEQSLGILAELHQLEHLELRMNFINSCNLSSLGHLPALKVVDISQNMLNFLPTCTTQSTECQSIQSSQNQNWDGTVDSQNQNWDGTVDSQNQNWDGTVDSQSQNWDSTVDSQNQNWDGTVDSQNQYWDGTVDSQNPHLVLWDRRAVDTKLWDLSGPAVSATKPGPTMVEKSEDDVSQIPTIWFFKNSSCSRRLSFDLSQNAILSLNSSMFTGMERAVCLDLSYNYLSQALNGRQFLPLSNLAYLNMAYNRIDFYYKEAFQELNATLKGLDLSNNEFHFLMRGMGHRLEFIQHLPCLEMLSLNNNGIGMRIDRKLNSTSLRYLYFSGNRLDIMWDPRNNGYANFFQDLTNLTFLDISSNQLWSLSPDVFCNLPRNLSALRVSDNYLTYFPWENITVLGQLRHLNLSRNYLSKLPNKVIHFGLDFAFLDLSHNQISQLPEAFFNQTSALRYLYLNNNKLMQLDQQTLPAPLRNGSALQELTLHSNQFVCDCNTSWFADFLRGSSLQIPYLNTHVSCEFPKSLQGASVLSMDSHFCQELYGSLAYVTTSFLVIVFTALPLLRHLYGWDLWYCLQVLWAGHKGYSQLPDGELQSQYDAFVVFDTGNQAVRDWVYNELTVNLENEGRRRFHLCLEERDWVPGHSCIENLHSAVYGSMKTVFVLSSSGIGPGNGTRADGVIRQAFFMVQQRLLDEKMDVAVLVLLDEVFPKMKYLQLRKRLCRKSVLSWPRNPRAQPLFWTHIRATLASDNLRSYDTNMSESFL